MKIKPLESVVTTRNNGKITIFDIRKVFDLPADAVVVIDVPSGGDYSGQTLEIGSVYIPHLNVFWETKE